MKKLILVMILLLSGCDGSFWMGLRGYDDYSSELNKYYRVVNTASEYSLIEVENPNKSNTDEYESYYLMDVPLPGPCNMEIEIEVTLPDGTTKMVWEQLQCHGNLYIELKELSAYDTYYITFEEKYYSLRELEGVVSKEILEELFSHIDEVMFFVKNLE